jgi:hypothetical protein
MGLGHQFSRVSYAAGPVVPARGPSGRPALPASAGEGRRGGEQPSKWGRVPMARPRALGDAGSNRKEREMKGSIVCAARVCASAAGPLDR